MLKLNELLIWMLLSWSTGARMCCITLQFNQLCNKYDLVITCFEFKFDLLQYIDEIQTI